MSATATPPASSGSPTKTQKRPWVAHAIWAAIVVVPFTILLISALLSELPEGQCSGIGWGCTVAGTEAAALLLIFVGIPLAFIWLLGHGVIALVQWTRRKGSLASADL